MEEEIYYQSDIATAVAFVVVLAGLYFFENLIGLKGFVRVLAAAGMAYLYRNYWGELWGMVEALFASIGLVSG